MEKRQKKVAIVGGGISGLSCAYWLRKHAQLDQSLEITVYEKNQDCGGRIKTMGLGNTSIELGAEFFHKSDLGLLRLLREIRLENQVVEREERGSLFTASERFIRLGYHLLFSELDLLDSISFLRFVKGVEKRMWVIGLVMDKFANSPELSLDRFILDDPQIRRWAVKNYEQELESHISKNAYKILMAPILKAALLSNPANLNCFSGMALTPSSFASYLTIEGGLKSIIEKLKSELDELIRLNSDVEDIGQTETGLKLLLYNGQKVDADIIVWSAPEMARFLRNALGYRNQHTISTEVSVVKGKLKKRFENNGGIMYVEKAGEIHSIRDCGNNFFRVVAETYPTLEYFFSQCEVVVTQYWHTASTNGSLSPSTNPATNRYSGLYVLGDGRLPTMNMAVIEGKKIADEIINRSRQ